MSMSPKITAFVAGAPAPALAPVVVGKSFNGVYIVAIMLPVCTLFIGEPDTPLLSPPSLFPPTCCARIIFPLLKVPQVRSCYVL